ncbi:recombinase family protein [Pseudomonas sp. RIT-PI-S]|uniref:recombinase family protein n=1 Tax=Pseudomonas sp. RIT-PI-S TaxID=3035295 RepID=UPI0021D88DAF|nr:recombinase family protein [Pseudomonas sp. RIT-PI-S]
MQPKAYSYIRFSSPEQAKGDSQRRQRDAATAYCKEHGLELAKAKEYTFFDAGRSAYKGEHVDDSGELARFLTYVNDGTVPSGSYLLVESLDRLSRDEVMVALNQFTNLLRKGIKIVTLCDKRVYSEDSPSIAVELIVSITVMMRAHEESATKGKRVSAAWQHKRNLARDSKVPLGNACPAWLVLENGAYRPIKERVDVIHRIFDMAIHGHGQTSILRRLNEDGIPVFGTVGETGRNRSGAWGTSSVGKILNNRSLLGEYQPMHIVDGVRCNDGDAVIGYYPTVIDEGIFLRARAARTQRRNSQATRQTKNFNIWQGLAKCRICGDAMHLVNKGKPPKGYTYLQCHTVRKGKCNNGLIRIEHAGSVFPEVLAKVDSMSLVHGKNAEIRKGLEIAEGKLVEVAKRLKQAEEAYTAWTSVAGAKLLHTLEAEHEKCSATRDEFREQLASTQVISKEDFFQKVDLVTYEGRAAANSLLKRLGIQVQFRRYSPTRFRCWVLDKSDDAITGANEQMLFGIAYEQGTLTTQAFDDDIYERQLRQGELTPEDVWRDQNSGIGGEWFM